ncbi:MAG: enoyl-CoA hydratase [Alphaproteobacteria bacterium]|nr:enoyl-CoA hydratase [Alphaproteobacteria bacterium]
MAEPILMKTHENGLMIITLNRPHKHHSMDAAMITLLADAARMAANDPAIRAVLIQSSGPSFCAGGDLDWMKAQIDASRESKMEQARSLADMLAAFYTLPCPVIARVQGNAYGGGLGLMAVADLVIAADDLRFAFTETRLGLIPATIGPFVLRRIGHGKARSAYITGSVMDTERAERLGLVSKSVPAEQLDEDIAREVDIVLKASPGAMARAKRLILAQESGNLSDDIDQAVTALADCWESPETLAGINAFFDRRNPPWIND